MEGPPVYAGGPLFILGHKRRAERMPARRVGTINPTGLSHMRLVLAALCIFAYGSMASAQTQLDLNRLSASQPINADKKEQAQPQGSAGPLTTGTGGATAANPQGGTPPNMHAAPEGSKTSADQK